MIAATDLQISVAETPDGWHWRIVGCPVGAKPTHQPEVLATSYLRDGAPSDVLALAEAPHAATELCRGPSVMVSVPLGVLARLGALYRDLVDELNDLRPGTPIPELVLGGAEFANEMDMAGQDQMMREGL